MKKLVEMQSRPASYAYSSRSDARYLATLINLWIAKDEIPRSISEMVRLSLETFVDLAVQSGQVDFVQTQEEAASIMASVGFLKGGLQKKHMTEAMVREMGQAFTITKNPVTQSPTVITTSDDPTLKKAQRELEAKLAALTSEDQEMLKALGGDPEGE